MTNTLEKDLSTRHWTIMYHLMTHMEAQLKHWGPVKDLWMFGFEDFFGHCMNQIKTRSHPVMSIMKSDRSMQTLNMIKELLVTKKQGNGARSHVNACIP